MNKRAILGLGLGGVMSLGMLSWITSSGIGLVFDTAIYADAARHIAQHQGVVLSTPSGQTVPLTHYPPLYSILLAGGAGITGDLFSAARLISTVFFGLNVLLMGLLLLIGCQVSISSALLGMLLLAFSRDFLWAHSMALSDPAGMFFGFLGLLLFGRFLEQERKGPLIACACSVALAALTRYAGIAFGIAALASLVLQARQERKPRWMMPAIFAAVCFCPIGFWLLRNHFLAGNAINRPLLFHPVLLKDGWPQLIEVLASWVFQEKAFPWSWTVCAALLVVSIGLIWRGKDASRTFARTRTLHILFAGIYLAMLTACFLFLEVDLAPMPFNRILIPLHISWLMLLVVRIDRFAKEPCRRAGAAAKAAVLAALLAYGAFFLWRAGEWIASRRDDSRNYAGARWKTSALLAELREHPRRERMFSNDPAALSLYLNISAYFLPAPNGYAAMVEHVRHGEAVIVLFDGPNDRFPNLHRRLRAEPGLGMLYQSSDGTVYGRRAARTQS